MGEKPELTVFKNWLRTGYPDEVGCIIDDLHEEFVATTWGPDPALEPEEQADPEESVEERLLGLEQHADYLRRDEMAKMLWLHERFTEIEVRLARLEGGGRKVYPK